MKKLLSCMLLFIPFLSACGGGSGTPTAPSSTSRATRVIALEGSLAFGDVVIGQTKELAVTIRNSGTGAMTMSGITGSGGIVSATTASPTTGTIASGDSLGVTFRFAPTAVGSVTGTVTFTTDHTSGTNTLELSGNGIAAPVTVVGVVTDAGTTAAFGGVRGQR